ncbi:MAG: secondary thiamine-phosphate synthase enzyme YjbQ [Nanoarchaeota archaeon]|nr:secondary thiamine-phosphate synthase enzyme YjbQ [Nanoarchaeota archaeon]
MEFTIKSTKREEIVDITKEVEKIVDRASDADSKACLVYALHSTCAVLVNENYDKAVCEDILTYLKKQSPSGIWKHDAVANNGDAHIKASIIGPSQLIPIQEGKLQLGKWQNIALAEFDGPRERKIIVKII